MNRTILYRILTVLASIGIFIIVGFVAVMIPANSKSFYRWQFEKHHTLEWVQSQADRMDNELNDDYDPYAVDYVANMTEQQLEDLMLHVMRYCLWLEDDINITVDGRRLNIFRADERAHMKDARGVFGLFIIITLISLLACIVFLFFIINRTEQYYKSCRKIPFITLGVVFALFLAIAICALVDFKFVYEVVFHNLFFSGNFAFSHGVMISMIGEIFPDLCAIIGIALPVLLLIPVLVFIFYNRALTKKYAKAQAEEPKITEESNGEE